MSNLETIHSCDASRIRLYLSHELTVTEQADFETHLTSCVLCQRELESRAAEKTWWSLASTALSESFSDTSVDSYVARPAGYATFMTEWLAPATIPESLGRLGKYEILEEIGRGGMGLVLKGLDVELNRSVAIKTLATGLAFDSEARLRFHREAKMAANLSHPNLITIFEADSWKGIPFIVMPYIEGGNLQQYAQRQRLKVDDVLQVLLQVTQGLAEMHRRGMVHRDLKPSNILLKYGLEQILVSDFGLARLHNDDKLTESNVLPGTPYFMSPEQALGLEIDSQSDLFSLGSLFFWMCTKKYPFEGRTNYETLHMLINARPKDSELDHVPSYVKKMIMGLLQKDPKHRWESASTIVRHLQACIDYRRAPSQFPLPKELVATCHSWKQRSRKWMICAIPCIGLASIVLSLRSISNHFASERTGILDGAEEARMLSDLSQTRNLRFWLRRLAPLEVADVPAESIAKILPLLKHTDPTTRGLAETILNRNPFQFLDPSDESTLQVTAKSESTLDENPFIFLGENETPSFTNESVDP